MKIDYITYARMPTEKAHGLQIHKMCEAYTLLGHEMTLVVPRLHNNITQSLCEYYSCKKPYSIKYLGIFDFIFYVGWLGFWAHRLNVGMFMLRLVFYKSSKDTIIMTRTPELAWLFKLRGYKVICEVHDWPGSWERVFLYLLRRVDLLVCNSEGIEEEFQSRGLTQTLVAHNAVDVEEFNIDVSQEAARKQLGLPLDTKIVMYIGSLEAWKGVETLFAASEALPDNYKVVIIGGTKRKIGIYNQKYPSVTFLGSRPYEELPVNQRAADILVVPNSPDSIESQKYTSPIKLFAHLLSKVPILVSRLPSIENIVDEEEVFFFEPGSAEDLARKLTKILENKTEIEKKTKKAYTLGTDFSWKQRAGKIISYGN